MSPRAIRRVGMLSAAVLACACGGTSAQAPATGSGTALTAESGALAVVGGDTIRVADLGPLAATELRRLEVQHAQQRQAVLEQALRQEVGQRVLQAEANRLGIGVEALLAREAGGTLEVSSAEVAAWYAANADQLGGRTLEQLGPQIAEFLRDQRRRAAATALQERLAPAQDVRILLEPYRVPLDNAGAPAKGPEGATVTLTEFSDFECPYCARFFPTLKRIEAEYGDRVRIVYRQFPLTSIHPHAFKAAEASLCAHEQGKFWELHDLMFEEQEAIDVASVKAKAGRLGLDQAAFNRCLDSGRNVEQVEADLEAGAAIGVSGTPALFVNGIPLPGGAAPFEEVARVIEAELARAGR